MDVSGEKRKNNAPYCNEDTTSVEKDRQKMMKKTMKRNRTEKKPTKPVQINWHQTQSLRYSYIDAVRVYNRVYVCMCAFTINRLDRREILNIPYDLCLDDEYPSNVYTIHKRLCLLSYNFI